MDTSGDGTWQIGKAMIFSSIPLRLTVPLSRPTDTNWSRHVSTANFEFGTSKGEVSAAKSTRTMVASYRCRFLTHRGRQSIVSSGADSRIRLWDAASLERQGEFQSRPDKDDPIAITISRSGDHAAFCNSPQTVAIWDLRRNQLVSELAVSYVGNIAFSPSEDLLAILYRNRVSVWDPKEQRRLVDTQIDARVARQVVFSPDGSTLAVACHDGNVKLIDIAAFFARRRKTSYRNAYSDPGRSSRRSHSHPTAKPSFQAATID